MTALAVSSSTLNPALIRRDLQLSRERMARILRVSAKTIERWENRNQIPDARAKQDFAKIRQIAELALAVYGPQGLEAFLTTPMAVFDGHTALDMMGLGEYDRVISALAADFEGSAY